MKGASAMQPAPLISIVPSARIRVVSSLHDRVLQVLDQPAHSWVRNFHNYMYAIAAGFIPSSSSFGAGYLSLKDTGGTVRNAAAASYSYIIVGPVSNSNYGILCGRSSSTESYEHYALQTPITHGTGSNQLSHRVGSTIAPAYTSGTKTWNSSFSRVFDNSSGSTITVTETGIVAMLNNTAYYFLMSRDLLGASVDVPHNGIITVTYDISLQFPN